MPRNLELKMRISSASEAEAMARECGAEFRLRMRQTDTYFRANAGRLKLREQEPGGAELIGYARPDTAGARWSEYVKVPVVEPETLKEILTERLGVRLVVEKERTLYLYKGSRIHIDEVRHLGPYLEFEVIATAAQDADAIMAELCRHFRVEGKETIGASYSDLLSA